jgi:PKD repeat protein
MRLTHTAQGGERAPVFSPVGTRIAFECEIEVGNRDLCAIHADGTGYTRLTNTAERGEWGPVFSPDGTRIAFTGISGFSSLWILNADGSVIDLGVSSTLSYMWSPDGTRLVYDKSTRASGCDADGTLCGYAEIYTVNLDGTGATLLSGGANPSLALSTGGLPAFGYFTASCITLACTFDASLSTGERPIVRYEWDYGDGTTGETPVHRYTSAGSYAVNLTVVDDAGARASWRRTVTVSEFPSASFTLQCDGLSCVFNGTGSYDPDGIATYAWDFGDGLGGSGDVINHRYVSTGTYPVTLMVFDSTGVMGIATAEVTVTNRQPVAVIQFSCGALRCYFSGSLSSDADGTIVSYAWSFGDGTQAADVSPTHTFAAAGTYSVGLTVTDNAGGTATAVMTVTVAAPRVMHLGDLDAAKTVRNRSWDAFFTVTVHDAAHQPVANAFVYALWTTGAGRCTTDSLGVCTFAVYGLANSRSTATFAVHTVESDGETYNAAANHDPDGETDGTRVTIRRK